MLKRHLYIIGLFIFLFVFVLFSFYIRFSFEKKYDRALEMINEKEYDDAIEELTFLSEYKYEDSISKLEYVKNLKKYQQAMEFYASKHFDKSADCFQELGDFKDSSEMYDESMLKYAIQLYHNQQDERAYLIFQKLEGYKNDVRERYINKILLSKSTNIQNTIYADANKLFEEGDYSNALNLFKQLGDYEESSEKVNMCIDLITKNLANSISSGLHHSVAIKDGEIICTDSRYKFDGWNNVISVSGFGTMIIGLNKDGTVELEGCQDKYDINEKDIWEVNIDNWKNIVQVSSGQQHVVGLNEDGEVISAGLINETEDWKEIKMIATGWGHTVGLDLNGEIHYAGNVSKKLKEGIGKSKGKWDDIIAIDTGGGNTDNVHGRGHIVGLRKDGTVIAVGDNTYGQCNVNGEEWADIVAIAAGDFHTVGLKSDGTVVATEIPSNVPVPADKIGEYRSACNVYGEKWKGIVAISAGYGTTLGLNENGEVVSAGFDTDDQIPKDYEWTDIVRYDEWRSMKGDD